MRIKEQSADVRPYEKFEKYGPLAMTDTELLAILLRSGTVSCNVHEMATTILTKAAPKSLNQEKTPALVNLYELSYEQLINIKGVGKVKALQILAILELCQRLTKQTRSKGEKINSPSLIANYFMQMLRHAKEEHFIITLLDAKCKMMGYELVSKGSMTASIVHPREVYKLAIRKSAYSIIALHNHPSGDPTPSKEDLQMTKRLKEVGELVGIPLLDHVIIGDGHYISLKEESYL